MDLVLYTVEINPGNSVNDEVTNLAWLAVRHTLEVERQKKGNRSWYE